MKLEQRLYGCGCKGKQVAVPEPAETSNTTVTTEQVPTVEPTTGS